MLGCPKCGKKFPLKEIKVKTVIVDQCPNCEGVWFDFKGQELLEILKRGYDNLPEELKKSWEGSVGVERGKEGSYQCPRCGNRLSNYWYCAEKNKTFLIDGCPKGCGVWLDDGELKKAYQYVEPYLPKIKEGEIKKGIFMKLWNYWQK